IGAGCCTHSTRRTAICGETSIMQGLIRYFYPILILGIATSSAWSQAAGSLQATARLDRKDIQLGQSAVVLVEFSGCTGLPEITPPQSPDCSITLAGRPIRSPALAGIGRKDGL